MNAHRKTYKYGTLRLQNNDSNTCGLFCLYYTYYTCRGCLLESVTNNFTNNLHKNKIIVVQFAKGYMKKYDLHLHTKYHS